MNLSSFYCYCRKLYCCDLLNWHPVFGVSDRPFKMQGSEFDKRIFGDSQWWMWKEYDNEVPSHREMIDELEFAFGRFYRVEGNKFKRLKKARAVRLSRPIRRVSKWMPKKPGNFSVVFQWYLPPTTFAVKDDIKRRAFECHELIKSGVGVRKAMKMTNTRYENLKMYTDFEPFRVKESDKKVQEVIKLIKSGMKQAEALRQVGLPKFTFWNKTGGVNKILNENKE